MYQLWRPITPEQGRIRSPDHVSESTCKNSRVEYFSLNKFLWEWTGQFLIRREKSVNSAFDVLFKNVHIFYQVSISLSHGNIILLKCFYLQIVQLIFFFKFRIELLTINFRRNFPTSLPKPFWHYFFCKWSFLWFLEFTSTC